MTSCFMILKNRQMVITANTALIEKICVWKVQEERKRGKDILQINRISIQKITPPQDTKHNGYSIEETQ